MTVIDVAAGLVFRDGLLLITQRPEGSHLAGLWEFPGGKLHPGEDWETALRRELIEELGFEASVGLVYEEVIHPYPEKSVRLRFFLCTVKSGEPHPIQCADLTWIRQDELSRFEFPPADARLLERLARDTEAWEAEANRHNRG
jgi:mutator protein MutT